MSDLETRLRELHPSLAVGPDPYATVNGGVPVAELAVPQLMNLLRTAARIGAEIEREACEVSNAV